MNHKNVLIVGGTGSWAEGLIDQLLKIDVAQIKILARNEWKIVSIKQKYQDPRVIPEIGDIRDKSRLSAVCRDCDIIFHLAALKHVPICEAMPAEAVMTNVIGTQNVIECAIANHVSKVIYVSTDKAVEPNCTYGCTKLLGEKLMLAANNISKDSKFIIFRSGNLLGSSGSVIPLFKKQIEQYQEVNLTDKKMNRFFISIPKISELLVEAATRGAGGEIFLPQMNSITIFDIARYLLSVKGLEESRIRVVGLRPGEKINESMATMEESGHIYKINDELYMIVKNDLHSWIANDFVKKESNYRFRSQDAVISYEHACSFLKSANV